MTNATNATRNTRNTRRNTRKELAPQSLIVPAPVVTDKRIAPVAKTATDKAAEAAKRQAEREAKREAMRIAREAEKRQAAKFDQTCMSVGDALRAVSNHAHDTLEEGVTVASFLASKGLTKLTLKGLKDALPKDFIREGVIYMPCVRPATYEGCAEDEKNGSKVYYFVVKGKGKDAKRTWKTAQIYDFKEIVLWTPQVVRQLLTAAMRYDAAKRSKRNEELKATKHFYVLKEHNEKHINGAKVQQKTVVEDYVEVAKEFVKF